MAEGLIVPFCAEHADYLTDESRCVGAAGTISFPKTGAEVAEVLSKVRGGVTVQGARTGIVAGAVPSGGHVLNLRGMNGIGPVRVDSSTGKAWITVQPGALLLDICKAVEPEGFFFPPDPTESSASIGGMAATNASGARSYLYGPAREWISALSVVLADGDVLPIRRGETFADGRKFSLTTQKGRVIEGILPGYGIPGVKSAAGYYAADGMDIIDLFIGMEGTLGVITELELRLAKKPALAGGITIFLPSEEAAICLVGMARDSSIKPAAVEYFNPSALNLLRCIKARNPSFAGVPELPARFNTAIYLEFHKENEDELDECIMFVSDALAKLGVSDDDTWFATGSKEMERAKAFRHAVPEAVNLLVAERKKSCPSLTKLGTDMSVPDSCLEAVMAMYNTGLLESGLESVIFGHIGNNHLHVNILPACMEDYKRGRELYMLWAERVVEMGGSVSAEHGIGKIKTAFLQLMYGREGVGEMLAVKRLLDPDMRLNPGTLFER